MMKNNTQILKVGADTCLSALQKSIYEYLRRDHIVILDAIGEKSAYNATRAIIFAKRMMPQNMTFTVDPGAVIIDTKEGERRAIRWTLELKAS